MPSLVLWFLIWVRFSEKSLLEQVGRLDDPAIAEASGMVQSRKHPGIFWVHNDSRNASELFAVRRDGSLVRKYQVQAANVDWEDIAIDDSGHLYLGDIGNNDSRLPIRVIYRLDEPDPSSPDAAKLLKPTMASFYHFAPQQRFDAESLFVDRAKVFVISKRFDGQPAEIFQIPIDPPAPLLRPTLPQRVGALEGCVEPATGADLSTDGQRLAVVSTKAARIYQMVEGQGWSLVATVPFDVKHVEAICWEGNDLILASEDRSIYRIAAKVWRKAEKPPLKSKGDAR